MTFYEGLKKHGMDNQSPGKYKEVGPRSSEVSKQQLFESDKGDRLPLTQEKGRKSGK